MNLTPKQKRLKEHLDSDQEGQTEYFDDWRSRAMALQELQCRACIFCDQRPCKGCEDEEDGYCQGHFKCEHYPQTSSWMTPEEDEETWRQMLVAAGLKEVQGGD